MCSQVYLYASGIGRTLVRPFYHALIKKRTGLSLFCMTVVFFLCCMTSAAVNARAAEQAPVSEAGNGVTQDTQTGTGTCTETGSQTGTQTASEEEGGASVLITVGGTYEQPDIDAVLKRLNEIRMEACREGVPSPVTGDALTEDDYVPVQWSQALSLFAATRAAEGAVLHSHTRPNGEQFFTVMPAGAEGAYPYCEETLAWGFEGILASVDGWYTEKDSYLKADGSPAGHYMALISPDNRYVGLAGLTGYGGRDVCAGIFSDRDHPLQGQRPAQSRVEVLRSLLPEAVDGAVREAALRILLACRAVCGP